ncbi:MAG: hypothetical protein ACK4K7_03010 [Allosphingosinicella sp.]|uniref:hypothetical protein n=1 Tax=Allosphingosinicella sp. TaxID=2823234 RepID=UPI0039400344
MARRLRARRSVGYRAIVTLRDAAGHVVNITGWTFAMALTRRRGTIDIQLNMAANEAALGFYILDSITGEYSINVTPGALQSFTDTSGKFVLFGDILATQPGGAKAWIEDIELTVTEGPTNG